MRSGVWSVARWRTGVSSRAGVDSFRAVIVVTQYLAFLYPRKKSKTKTKKFKKIKTQKEKKRVNEKYSKASSPLRNHRSPFLHLASRQARRHICTSAARVITDNLIEEPSMVRRVIDLDYSINFLFPLVAETNLSSVRTVSASQANRSGRPTLCYYCCYCCCYYYYYYINNYFLFCYRNIFVICRNVYSGGLCNSQLTESGDTERERASTISLSAGLAVCLGAVPDGRASRVSHSLPLPRS